jgi:hypothetical protein
MKKKREQIDLTDKELYYIALSIESHLNSRDTYFTSKSCIIYNKMVKKIVDNGMTRKDPKSILHPIVKFEDEQY